MPVLTSLFGCTISGALIARWRDLIVCEPAPFFIFDAIPLPAETLILSRKEFGDINFDASLRDSYATYHVSRDATRVAFLSSEEFDALPPDIQHALLIAQHDLKRGQVYLWEQVAPFLAGCIELAETRSVTVSGEKYLVLDAKLWHSLPDDMQTAWLMHFVSMDKPAVCLSATLSEAEWSNMPYASIRALAGTFPAKSGANCFATTLAAVTQNPGTAMTIANFWLHQQPFLAGLERRGYSVLNETLKSDARDRVLVWNDDQGNPQHACYLIGNGRVLNKNSQAWYSPRQILHLDTVLNEWKHEPFHIAVYGRK